MSTDLDRIHHLPEGPLKMAEFGLWWIRETVFVKDKPDGPAFFVTLSETGIVELLGGEHFEPNRERSYSYRNETLNLRRVGYVSDHPDYPEFEWWQVHVRGYLHRAGGAFEEATFELAPHFELEPTEYLRAQVEHVGLEVDRGAGALMGILEARGVEYEFGYPSGEPATLGGGSVSDGAAITGKALQRSVR